MPRSSTSSSGSSVGTPKSSPSPSTNNETRRVRASRPKVKSGCITCKIRRVKCDEKRPGCDRCKKFGRECDGYTSKRLSNAGETLVPIQPRPGSFQIYGPAFSVPGDETERRYYQLFFNCVATNLAGYFPSDFWHRTVLRESQSDPAVRHALIALSALSMTVDGSQVQQHNMANPHFINSVEDHQYALSQYNKGIVCLRQSLAKGSPSIRSALVACLLFVCFENFHGDHEAANSHVSCGLGLLDQWFSQNPPADDSSTAKRRLLEAVHADEVFQMFSRLDAQSYAQLCASSSTHLNASPRLMLWESIADRGVDVPFTFLNVLDARACWDYLSQRTIAFHCSASSAHDAHPGNPPAWIDEEKESCILQLQQFEDAIWALVNAPESDPMLFTPGPTVLYLNNKIAIMELFAEGQHDESHWDGYLQEYEEIVERSARLVESMRSSTAQVGVFGFEIGIIAPLHLTAMKCRIPSIRRQAISMLLAFPRREGCWDGVLFGKVDSWLMGIEEEGLDEFGLVPSTSRWKLQVVKSCTQERWISAKAVKDDVFASVATGPWAFEAEWRETKISW